MIFSHFLSLFFANCADPPSDRASFKSLKLGFVMRHKTVFAFNFLCIIHDVFNLFACFAWAFHDPGSVSNVGWTIWLILLAIEGTVVLFISILYMLHLTEESHVPTASMCFPRWKDPLHIITLPVERVVVLPHYSFLPIYEIISKVGLNGSLAGSGFG